MKIIRELHGLTTGKTIELDEETVAGWNKLSHLKEQIKDLTKEADEIKAIISHKLADAEAGLFPRGTKQIKRSVVRTLYWTDSDLEEIRSKVGQVKRKGHERLLESRVKESK